MFLVLLILHFSSTVLAQRELPENGVDSVTGTWWKITNVTSVFSDRDGYDSAFAEYERREYSLDSPDSIVIYVCGELVPWLIKYAQYPVPSFPVTAVFRVKEPPQNVSNIPLDLLSASSYKRGMKHGWEYEYYHWRELQGMCILGNFRIKSKGQWKYGHKKGKWVYYNKDGTVLRTKKY